MPPILAEFYGEAHFNGSKGPIVAYDSQHVKSVRTAWRKARAKAGLDKDVQPYSLRHTVARWLRKDGVPVWEVAAQLGHSTARHEMTERYAAFSPDYLEKSATSLDKLLNEVRDNCVTLSKSRFAVKVPKSPSVKGKEWWSMQGLNLRPLQCQWSNYVIKTVYYGGGDVFSL